MSEKSIHDLPSEYKHRTVLALVGVALEGMGVSEELHTVNEIAEKAHLHHRTVKKCVEAIYYEQHFVPEIDIIYHGEKPLVHVKGLPKYVRLSTEPGYSILVKLFHAKAYFGKMISISSLNLSSEEIKSLEKIAQWILIDHYAGTIGLSIEGSKYAFNIVEGLANIRDKSIISPPEVAIKLRELDELLHPKKGERSIDEFVAMVRAVGTDNVQSYCDLLREIPSVLNRIEHAESILKEVKGILYKNTYTFRPIEIMRRI